MAVCVLLLYFILQVLAFSSHNTRQDPFDRSIVAVGHPYFKIVMKVGTCHKALIFQDQKIWTNQRLNRIMDIYYKSDNPAVLVSRVEIHVVVNNTDCYGYTATGVGSDEFIGALLLPSNSGLVFYHLLIFTCDIADLSVHCLDHMLQFYVNPKAIEELVKPKGTVHGYDRARTENDHDLDDLRDRHTLCRYEWSQDEITENPIV